MLGTRLKCGALLLVVSWLGMPSAVEAQTLRWPCERAFADRRSSKLADDTYVVVFFARKGLPGHVYVATGRLEDGLGMMQTSIFGFYPSATTKGIGLALGLSAPGKIDVNPDSDATPNIAVNILVNEEQHWRVKDALASKWSHMPYSLFKQNCNNLLADAAKELGLSIPASTFQFPDQFLNALIVQNGFVRVDECRSSPATAPSAPSTIR